MSKAQNHNILYQLTDIELVGQALSLPADFTVPEVYEYEVAAESRLNQENKLIRLRLDINIKSEAKTCGSLSAVFYYSIANFEEVIVKNKSGKYEIPEGLQLSLNSIAISTARGMLFSAFRGTVLHNAILPIIDPKHLLGS